MPKKTYTSDYYDAAGKRHRKIHATLSAARREETIGKLKAAQASLRTITKKAERLGLATS